MFSMTQHCSALPGLASIAEQVPVGSYMPKLKCRACTAFANMRQAIEKRAIGDSAYNSQLDSAAHGACSFSKTHKTWDTARSSQGLPKRKGGRGWGAQGPACQLVLTTFSKTIVFRWQLPQTRATRIIDWVRLSPVVKRAIHRGDKAET